MHPQESREFLGWDKPALPEAARRLAARYREGRILDLKRVIIVVPGQRAGRRLQELLAFLAEEENLRLTPPLVTTEGHLPEELYTPKLPFASEIVQDLAWAQALRDLPAEILVHVVPHPPATADAMRWLELGKMLRGLHVELAADGLDFAAVHKSGTKLADFTETERWETLVTVQQRYHDLLDQQKLWDTQTARLKAIELRETRSDCDIVLLGTVDLNNTLRQMLEQVATRVTAYIVAPEDLVDRFDAHGCLMPASWCNAMVPLREKQLRQVDGAEEQADCVSRWLVELGGLFQKDEIAIGVPDESLVPQLQRQLEQCGVRARWVAGARLVETAPYRLLAAAVQFAGARRYDDLAALFRHPDLEDWLTAKSLPGQLDRFYNACLPSRIRSGESLDNNTAWPDLAQALKRIDAWLEDASANHRLRGWGELFPRILSDVYGDRTLQLDVPADEALHRTLLAILEQTSRLASLPEAFDTLSLSAADAFQFALGPLGDETLPPPADPDAVEILGWLELPLDDARALVVTSFNEGFVPKSTGADAFLPDRLRRELGLLHNERRYARDAFAMSVLCQSRQELKVLFARRDTKKDPLQPSRLVFACSDEALVDRARRFFAEQKTPARPRRLLLAPSGTIPKESEFKVPVPAPLAKRRQQVSVTEFKAYLSCPYRYYLRHVLKLKAVDDSARELDGSAFGTLMHRVLGAFGRDSRGPRDSDQELEIFAFLAEQLDAQASKIYGREQRCPALHLQLEQARARLRVFASRQAALVGAGWHIVYAEDDENDRLSAPFAVDQEPITLVGRIDRIDFNDKARTLRILDYKTADTGESPEKAHQKGATWIDLQLPLYRHLWPAARQGFRTDCLKVPTDCKVDLGYVSLSKELDKIDVISAGWDEAALNNADEVARQLIRDLRNEVFGPPVYPAPKYNEDLGAICLDSVLSRPGIADADQGGAA